MTSAMGLWISLPGLSPASTSGMSARPARERGHEDGCQPLLRAAHDRLVAAAALRRRIRCS